MIKIKKGLDLPIEGSPEQKIYDGPNVTKFALIGDDLVGMKPTMEVKVGDQVKIGQLLYTDKKTPGIRYTSPACGEVIELNRGEKRAFQSVVIKATGDDHVTFEKYKGGDVSQYSEQDVRDFLNEAGMWASLKRRPYSKVAVLDEKPSAIFVNAMDTHPLAADPQIVLANQDKAFNKGLEVLKKLCDTVYVCHADGAKVPFIDGVKTESFSGPHPAGLTGTHIHFLNPVGESRFVWSTNYQEVIAMGKLFETGQLYLERVISLAGPVARNPRLIKTRLGASIEDLTKGETFESEEVRPISGSVFGGRKATGPFAYLGRFHHQISLLREGRDRELLGWHSPGFNKFSVKPIYVTALLKKKFGFDTNANGSLRSIVPIESYEKVMPLDILPTHLLRTLMSGNTEMAAKLGALELDEEDLALCTFVDPSKNDFAPKLRDSLTTIEKEG